MESISTGTFDAPRFVRAAGSWLYDESGTRYFDGTSGSGAVTLGHQHPRINAAVREQLDKLVHTGCKFGSDIRATFIEKLCALSPFKRPAVLPAVIGTEAVEASLKIARARTGRTSVVCFKHAYHGKSSGALCLTWREPFKAYSSLNRDDVFVASLPPIGAGGKKDGLAPYLGEVERVFDTAASSGRPPAAVILEPVQVTEGVLSAGERFLEGLIQIAHKAGALVIFDEIYTGLGRCGTRFYCDRLEALPDLLVVGKSLGNGFPISAVVGEAEVVNALPAGIQTSTYSGHPISAAAASAVIDVAKEIELWDVAKRRGAMALDSLRELSRKHDFIAEPRGEGMLLAFDCVSGPGKPAPARAKRFVQAALRNHLLLFKGGPDDCTVKVVPPVVMQGGDLEFLLQTMAEIADEVGAERAG